MTSYEGFIEQPPIVFISYSWTSNEHIEKVLKLAQRLRSDGVDVRIDKWDLKEGQDKFDFMERMVKDDSISKVLLLCDKVYAEKADLRMGGVGSEAQIITPELYENAQNDKFIPVIFERAENGKEYLPTFLKARIYIDLSDEAKFEQEYIHLLRAIFEHPESQKPPLGTPPTFLFDEKTSPITKTLSKVNQFKQFVIAGKPIGIGAFEDYLDCLYNILKTDFRIEAPSNDKPFDEIVIDSINQFLPYRDEFIEVIQFIVKYRLEKAYFESVYVFFCKLLNLFYDQNDPIIYDNYRFIAWELFLYVTAILINARKIDEFEILVEKPYFIKTQYFTGIETFIAFRSYIRSFEDRKRRLQSNAISLMANELRQRCYPDVSFDLLVQADLILFIRSIKNSSQHVWFPIILIFGRSNRSEFFIKAEYTNEFDELLRFIKCQDKDELFNILQNDRVLQDSYFCWVHLDIFELTNFEKLGTK